MFKKKSILFVTPDYHCSFILRDEFRRLGWRADIYIPLGYPEKLLYQDDGFRLPCKGNSYLTTKLCALYFLFLFFMRYKYILLYGGMNITYTFGNILRPFLGDGFCADLALAKYFKKILIYLPSGCFDEETRANISKLDEGNLCNNCGWGEEVCNDENNIKRFNIKRRYMDLFIGNGSLDSTQFPQTHLKYKSLDLEQWHPQLKIPREFLLPPTRDLRILHGYFDKNRKYNNKNIKGSPFIVAAIERLKSEGHSVEYYYLDDVPSKFMRYYQVQADIVVEQLIYGWWGSTGIETMALGKPVVCYLRSEWKEHFMKTFPEYDSLPIVEATTSNIYEVLKELIVNKEYREQKGRDSRLFAEKHFDVKKNAVELERVFLKL